MFDLTKFMKDEILEDHVGSPIKIKNDTEITDFSQKYDIRMQTLCTITVSKKKKEA